MCVYVSSHVNWFRYLVYIVVCVHPLQVVVLVSTVVQYLYFKSQMSRSKCESSGDGAGAARASCSSVAAVQSLSRVRLFATPQTAARQASLSFTISQSLLKFISIVSDATQPSHPLSSPSLPAFNLSQHQGLFQGVSSSYQVATVLGFQLQHQSFQ